MGSQFVDLNGDSHTDILSATFDGSPHIAYGSAKGFRTPVRIHDADGERLLITYYWDYDEKKHLVTGRSFDTDTPSSERCISALAFDWDADGDLDLLLGSYENGHLYRQMNIGSATEPKFTGKNIPVMAGRAQFAIRGKMTTPRLVDWDADGDLDLIAGSFGDTYRDSRGGGVFLFRNEGTKGKPRFAAPQTLIPESTKGQNKATRPDAGLYADAVDFDGDGDLDLVVGGYSIWTPKPKTLTVAEQASVKRLTAEKREISKRRRAIYDKINTEHVAATEGMDRSSPEARAKHASIRARYQKESRACTTEFTANAKALNLLVPTRQRQAFVWLYERQ